MPTKSASKPVAARVTARAAASPKALRVHTCSVGKMGLRKRCIERMCYEGVLIGYIEKLI